MPEPPATKRGLLAPSMDALAIIGETVELGARAFMGAFERPLPLRDTLRQIDAIGWQSMPIVLLMAVSSSTVLTLQTGVQLERYGSTEYVGVIAVLSLFRELGPVLTGLVVAGRVGAGITAELGSMNVTEQIDALRSMGTDPLRKLVAPRLVAATLSLPLLTGLADLVGAVASMATANVMYGIDPVSFVSRVLDRILLNDFVGGVIKGTVFGAILGAIACRYGLSTAGGTAGVGRSTTASVVVASVAILITDFVLTYVLIPLGY